MEGESRGGQKGDTGREEVEGEKEEKKSFVSIQKTVSHDLSFSSGLPNTCLADAANHIQCFCFVYTSDRKKSVECGTSYLHVITKRADV